jgi:hypothetical protein
LLRSLYAEIIRSLDADVLPTMRLHELETRAIGMLQHAAPRMLLIDEIQHLLSCGLRDQRAALNAIKFLANKLRISIVAAGTHEALHVMRADPQIASRFEQLELPVWTESQELRRFIAGYLALLPIKRSPAAIDKCSDVHGIAWFRRDKPGGAHRHLRDLRAGTVRARRKHLRFDRRWTGAREWQRFSLGRHRRDVVRIRHEAAERIELLGDRLAGAASSSMFRQQWSRIGQPRITNEYHRDVCCA